MGLDDFVEDAKSSSTDNSSSKSNNETTDAPRSDAGDDYDSIESTDMEFYGSGNADVGVNPMERKGAMSNFTTAQLAKDTDGTIEIDRDNIKFHAPIFPIITPDDRFDNSERYQLKSTNDNVKASWNGRVVSCVSSELTKLGMLNKEFIMFTVGAHSKKIAMERVKDIMGDGLDGHTEVYVNFFGDAMFMRDMAQANEEYRHDETVDVDQIGSRVVKKNMLKVGLNQQEE